MSSYDDLIRSITVRYNDKIVNVCAPVFDFFNLDQFYYIKITDQGYFSAIDSHASFAEYWSSEKIYLSYPFYRHPKYYKEGISVLQDVDSVEDRRMKGILDPLKEKFNFQTWLRVVNKVPDGIEEFGFSSYSTLSSLHCSQLLNEIVLFRLFLKHFKDENQPLFSKLEDNQINIAELIGPDFHKNDMPKMPKIAEKQSLLKQLGITVGPALTAREVEISRLLLAGYSAGMVASHVYLSKRTVEHQIERLKDKLSCQSKSELIQKARELEHLGYLNVL